MCEQGDRSSTSRAVVYSSECSRLVDELSSNDPSRSSLTARSEFVDPRCGVVFGDLIVMSSSCRGSLSIMETNVSQILSSGSYGS